jgi:hypothetical protein
MPMLITVALYGYAIGLPYFLDDGPHFVILGMTDGLLHWGDFPTFPFYRPLAFTVWKLFEGVGYPAFALHALNVFTFGLVGIFAGQIARRLSGSDWAGVLSGCFVISFPFSYHAVVMVAALFHLLMALGATFAILSALIYQQTKHPRDFVLCLLGVFIALFSHENGVLIAVLLPSALAIVHRRVDRLFWRLTLPTWGITAVYILLWLAFSPNDEARTLSTEPLTSFAALSQGIIYPFIALMRPFFSGDASPYLLVGVAIFIPVMLLYSRKSLVMLYGVVWYGVALLPATLILPPSYVLGQLRLSLFASIGAGIFWGIGLSGIKRGRFLSAVLILVASYVSVDFLMMRRMDFLRLADWNAHVITLASDGDGILINAPMSLAPSDANRRFLLGSEGVLWTDPSLDYSQQFWLQGVEGVNAVAMLNPALIQAVDVRYTPHGDDLQINSLRQADFIIYTEFMPNGRFVPRLVAGGNISSIIIDEPIFYPQVDAKLEGGGVWHEENTLIIRTRWHFSLPVSVKMFIHAVCDGQLIAQNDGYIWGGNYPFSVWLPNETQTDQRYITLPNGMDSTCLSVRVGLYYENTGERLIAQDNTDNRLPDDAYSLPLVP